MDKSEKPQPTPPRRARIPPEPAFRGFARKRGPDDTRENHITEAIVREDWTPRSDGSIAIHGAASLRQMSTEPPDVVAARQRHIIAGHKAVGLAQQVRRTKAREGKGSAAGYTLVKTEDWKRLQDECGKVAQALKKPED